MRRYLKDKPAAFDPATIDILSAALDNAWRVVESDKTAFKIHGHGDAARQILAKHIVDLASQGERDPQRLMEGALVRLKL